MKTRIAFALLLFAAPLFAQLPDHPQPQPKTNKPVLARTWVFVAVSAAGWAGSYADARISQGAFRGGCVEQNTFLVGRNARPSTGKLMQRSLVIEGPLTLLNYLLFRKLRPMNERPAWVVFPAMQIGIHMAATSGHCG